MYTEKFETTVTRAKEVRSVVDELITLGKRGDLHARRQAAADMHKVVDEATGKQLFKSYLMTLHLNSKDVNGGYTTILKTYNRKGDNAPMAILSLTK